MNIHSNNNAKLHTYNKTGRYNSAAGFTVSVASYTMGYNYTPLSWCDQYVLLIRLNWAHCCAQRFCEVKTVQSLDSVVTLFSVSSLIHSSLISHAQHFHFSLKHSYSPFLLRYLLKRYAMLEIGLFKFYIRKVFF